MGSGLAFFFCGSQILTLDVLVMYVVNLKKENAQSKKQDLTPIVSFIQRQGSR